MVVRSTVSRAVNTSVRATLGSGGGASGGGGPSYDTDAQTYFTAVEAEDGEALEAAVKDAINAFVVGCKDDGIWTAIKAACLLSGPRTLDGALVPLVGAAPTNVNFVGGDYSRTTGLSGNGTTKYLDSNRSDSDDPQNSLHLAVYASSAFTVANRVAIGSYAVTLNNGTEILTNVLHRSRNSTSFGSATRVPGLIANSRTGAAAANSRVGDATATTTLTSSAGNGLNHFVFARNQDGIPSLYAGVPLCWYSIGEAINLSKLKTRLDTLMTAIGAALA